MTVQPVGFNVVKREKFRENFPVFRHIFLFTVDTIGSSTWVFWSFSWGKIITGLWIRNQCIVLHCHEGGVIIESQVNFCFLPNTNLFVAFITNFLADQNVMSGARGDLTFYFRDEALAGLSLWNIDLN